MNYSWPVPTPTTPEPADQAALFRKMAAAYDATIRIFQPTYDDMLHLSTDLARAAAPGRARCLDYGSGTGAALPNLLDHFDEVVAMDPSAAMLDVARARVGVEGSRVGFREGTTMSSEATSLERGSFDAVHCSLVLMFVEGPEAKLATMRVLYDLLRPGGVLVQTEILVEPGEEATFGLWRAIMRQRGADEDQVNTGERQVYSHMHRTSASEARGLLEAAGFTQVTQAYQALHTAIFVARK